MATKPSITAPFLKRISLLPDRADEQSFPFNRFETLLRGELKIEFPGAVTFFVGENGTGKSTFLNAIAALCGFGVSGGGSGHHLASTSEGGGSTLASALRPSWLPRVSKGFFFRSDTFTDVTRYLDETGDPALHGDRRLDEQSHGESFFSVFKGRFSTKDRCIYLMDEPENALSPMRQLGFLGLLREWEESSNAQMIIATHSPILLSYPGATILNFDGESISPVEYQDIEHVQVTKAFLGNPERYLHQLFDESEGD
jgi:predicted ATPase